MPYRITEECVGGGTGAEECEARAIVEKDDKYEIADAGNECGNCIDACPVEALIQE